MTIQEITAWVGYLVEGGTPQAWDAIVQHMSDDDLLKAADANVDAWTVANAQNAANMDTQQQALMAVLQALILILLRALGASLTT